MNQMILTACRPVFFFILRGHVNIYTFWFVSGEFFGFEYVGSIPCRRLRLLKSNE